MGVSVGRTVEVGRGVLFGVAGEVGEEQERRRSKQKAESRILDAMCWYMERILSHLLWSLSPLTCLQDSQNNKTSQLAKSYELGQMTLLVACKILKWMHSHNI